MRNTEKCTNVIATVIFLLKSRWLTRYDDDDDDDNDDDDDDLHSGQYYE